MSATSPRSQRSVAKALGISRPLLQSIERRALSKLAAGLGIDLPVPAYALRVQTGTSSRLCKTCGEPGHNARACIA
jgi:hypothetical protein